MAESAQLVGLRAVLCRFLGWAPERQADVDNALRSLRDWAEHDLPLVLVGEGDLTPVVSRLHALALGPSVGLIVYDDGDPAAAIDGAQRGVLCVVMHRQAPMVRLVELLREAALGEGPDVDGLREKEVGEHLYEFVSMLLVEIISSPEAECTYFREQLSWFHAGRFPCGWEGDWPNGRMRVF